MYCTQCGLKLKDEDCFCAKCGAATRPDSPPSAESTRRRLTRPMEDKKIAGVCAGFARYLDVDVVLVRVICVAAVFVQGLGLIAYIVAWILMPKTEAPVSAPATERTSET